MENMYGVNIASEVALGDEKEDQSLGVIILPINKLDFNLFELRDVLKKQISNLPSVFNFLNDKGWEIQKSQDTKVKLKTIVTTSGAIRIKQCFGKPRIGIWCIPEYLCEDAKCGKIFIGFVLTEHSAQLKQFRVSIKEQIPALSRCDNLSFLFVDRNCWPIAEHQENMFQVMDIVNQNSVGIMKNVPMFWKNALDTSQSLDYVDSNLTLEKKISSNSMGSNPPILTKEDTIVLKKVNKAGSSSSSWISNKMDDQQPKQILLSYVRNEASEHAVCLKRLLNKLGFTVFLDVDEIKSGIDWQDSLNFAVSNCQVFIPLVTPRYGETQWTNREVKLADVLGKFILPVSFLTEWPPRVLAIQFATTQFIPWKPQKVVERQVSNGGLDIKTWEDSFLSDVVHQISGRLKEYFNEIDFKKEDSFEGKLKKVHTLKSCPAQLPDGFEELSQNRAGRPLIVISVHPQQKQFARELKEMLELEYDIWCSVDVESEEDELQDSDTPLFSQYSFTTKYDINVCSQESAMSSSSDCEFVSKKLRFQENADEAGVILVILSKAFAMSKTCKQQVFYCEHRKKIIPIKYEDFCMPGWMSMLIGTGILEDVAAQNFKALLELRIQQYLHNEEQEDEDRKNESMISMKAQDLKQQIPEDQIYVYIAGGTQFYNKESEEICRSIGKNLSSVNINLVTGGFVGVGETVATSYQQAANKDSNVYHILPKKDPKMFKHGPQKEDYTFDKVSFGTTLFHGDSVRERETIVSRIFDVCILVEGGPGAAHEAEQFYWNDKVVIPVKCTGGAAGGKFNVPESIFQVPYGVSESDWNTLQNDANTTAENIGIAVSNIVSSVSKRIKKCKRRANKNETEDSGAKHTSEGKWVRKNSLRGLQSSMGRKEYSLTIDTSENKPKNTTSVSSHPTSPIFHRNSKQEHRQNLSYHFTDIKAKSEIEKEAKRVTIKTNYESHSTAKEIESVQKCAKKPADCEDSPTVDALSEFSKRSGSPHKSAMKRRADVHSKEHYKTRASSAEKKVVNGSPKKRTRQNLLPLSSETEQAKKEQSIDCSVSSDGGAVNRSGATDNQNPVFNKDVRSAVKSRSYGISGRRVVSGARNNNIIFSGKKVHDVQI